MTIEIQTAIIIISNILANIIVGFILLKQIKAQKEIIHAYKGLVEATNPDKIILLHEREVNKIKETLSLDIKVLETQIIELGNFADKSLEVFKQQHAAIGKIFYREDSISINMPHCSSILSQINQYSNDSK